jgi:protein-S-isoprenylcysteine O-methyltransferase Ste14
MIPPKKLVVVGSFRYVQNPMFLGFITGWIGLWIVFGQANLVAIVIAFTVTLGVALFVVLMRNPRCAGSSVPSTKHIAGMCRLRLKRP